MFGRNYLDTNFTLGTFLVPDKKYNIGQNLGVCLMIEFHNIRLTHCLKKLTRINIGIGFMTLNDFVLGLLTSFPITLLSEVIKILLRITFDETRLAKM